MQNLSSSSSYGKVPKKKHSQDSPLIGESDHGITDSELFYAVTKQSSKENKQWIK